MRIHSFIAVTLAIIFATIYANAQMVSTGQGSIVDLSLYAKKSDLPIPSDEVPPTDTATGAAGTMPTYQRGNAIRPARYRSSTCVLSGGTCSLSWSTPFSGTPNPIGDPAVINTNGGIYIQCNWSAISAAGATIKCAAPLVTISLGLLNLLPAAPNGLVVAATAVQPL